MSEHETSPQNIHTRDPNTSHDLLLAPAREQVTAVAVNVINPFIYHESVNVTDICLVLHPS